MSRRGWYVLVGVVVAIAAAAAVLLLPRITPRAPTLHLDARAFRPESPAVSARYVAWTDRSPRTRNGIFVFDSADGTTRRVTPADGDCGQPALAGGTLVYVDHRADEGDVYRQDLGTEARTAVAVAPGRQGAPAADGDWVVWEDDRTGFGPRVHGRRLSGGAEVVVPTARPGGVQRRPQVGGGFVVFEEYAGGTTGGNAVIRGYDLVRGEASTLAASAGVHLLPSTDGTSVAWCEQRGSSLDVVLLDRRSGSRSSPPSSCIERTSPTVFAGTLYWVERCRQGHFELYAWRAGAATPAPIPGPGSVANRVAPRAAQGSRAWLELRQQRWYVRADLAGATASEGARSSARNDATRGREGAARPPYAVPRASLLPVQAASGPTAPGSPIASLAGTSGVLVTWRPATGGAGIAGYDVYRHSVPITPANLGAASKVASVTTLSALVPSASNEATTHYTLYYAVLARDAAGNTALSVNTVPDPHGTASGNTVTCQRCHLNPAEGPIPGARRACYSCHGDTPSTTRYGVASPVDVQAQFRDDTASPLPPSGSRHRNQYMTDSASECDACHTPHRRPYSTDPAASYVGLLRTQLATAPAGQSGFRYSTAASPAGNAFCFDCHGTDLTPISLVAGPIAYLNAGGDHAAGWPSNAHASAVATPFADPGIQCIACHDEHGSSAGALLGAYEATTNTNRIAGSIVTGNDNSVCLACHGGASAGWPAYSRDASGFPVRGTWPGPGFFGTPYDAAARTGSMHATRTAVWPGTSFAGGDCKNCHRMHGPSGPYDILRDTDIDGTAGSEAFSSSDFSFCFFCHTGTPGRDVARFYPPAAGGTSNAPNAGHATRTGGTLPAGSALPCYDCHNPHGTASAYGLAVVTQTSSTTTIVVGDATGELAMSPGRAAGDVRRFCLCCHTTADTAAGWNGAAFTDITSGAKVEGIDRVSTLSRLRLPGLTGHDASDTQSCYTCHGNDYSGAGSNVHSPGGGVSAGGVACYSCHGQFRETMDAAGTTRTSSFHHVLGTGTYDGDLAPSAGSYPSTLNPSAQAVYCVSCHTDHNYFNGDRGANLRLGIGLPGSQTTNTDFVATSPYGICVSCHAVSMTKDDADQKSVNASSRTPTIAGPDYSASKHRYQVPGSFSGSVFNVDCVKCHSDAQPASFQDGTFRFQLHYAAESRLLAALGTTIPASAMTEEALCYRCHSGTGTSDAYGASTMTTTSKSLATVFGSAYDHPVGSTSGVHRSDEDLRTAPRHVECEDCHDSHAARSGTHTPGSSAAGGALFGARMIVPVFPDSNFATPTAFTATRNTGLATGYEAYVCFACHSTYTTLPSTGGSGGFGGTDVAMEYNPANQSGHNVLGSATWPKTTFGTLTWSWPSTTTAFISTYVPNLGAGYTMTCSDCHTYNGSAARGPHGSTAKFILLSGGTGDWYRTTLSGWSTNLLCGRCHAKDSNNVHSESNHSGYTCERCHVRVPHGWKRPRMLVRYGVDAGAYVTTTTQSLVGFTYVDHTPTTWSTSGCQASCAGEHSNALGSPWP